jgi:hypothetical protein
LRWDPLGILSHALALPFSFLPLFGRAVPELRLLFDLLSARRAHVSVFRRLLITFWAAEDVVRFLFILIVVFFIIFPIGLHIVADDLFTHLRHAAAFLICDFG